MPAGQPTGPIGWLLGSEVATDSSDSGTTRTPADGGHEVHVARPPWHHMSVEMLREPRAGSVALVHAHIDSMRLEYPFDQIDAMPD